MKKIMFILLMMLPMFASPQNEQADELYDNGVKLYNEGKFEEAIKLFKKSDSIAEITYDKTSPNYYRAKMSTVHCLHNIAISKFNSNNYKQAIELGTIAVEIFGKYFGYEHSDYILLLDHLATYNIMIGNDDEAITRSGQAKAICERVYGVLSPSYAQALSNLAECCIRTQRVGYHELAIEFGTQALEIRKKVLGENHPDYATSLNNLASYNYKLGNNSEAVKLCKQALEIQEKILGKLHPDYALSLNNLAAINFELGHYSEAIKLGTQALEIQGKILGKEHPSYATSLSNLANCNFKLGKYEEAIKLETEALKIREKILGKEHSDYAISLNNLSTYNAELGHYSEAIKLCTQALEIREKNLGKEHPDYATSINNLGSCNMCIGNYIEAITLLEEALKIYKKTLGEKHHKYISCLSNLAKCNSEIGDYQEAVKLGNQVANAYKTTLGCEHPDYALSLNNLATYNAYIGNYTESITLTTQALEIQNKFFGQSHYTCATSLNNLATFYLYLTDGWKEAIKFETQAVDIMKNVFEESHPHYHKSLANLADINACMENYDEAITIVTAAIELQKKYLGDNNLDYSASLNNLAGYYAFIGNFKDAINIGEKALEIRGKILGRSHPYYAQSCRKLSAYYLFAQKYNDASKYIVEFYNLSNDFVLNNFSSMTYNERTVFWDMYSNFFRSDLPFAAYKCKISNLYSLAYNGQLFSKGLILNTEIELQKLIEKSGSQEYADQYIKLRSDRAMLDKLYEKPLSERAMNADSLSSVIEKEEKQLVENFQELGDYTKSLTIAWQDVQKQLSNTDIAIEFANFKDNDTATYIALILKKGMSTPELVKLDYDETEQSDYKTSKLYNQIWQPLKKYLNGVKNVYFSPSGKFHTIAIEYLPDDSGELFAKKYNAYRLSSTRELVLEKKHNPNKKAAVYGGIQYSFGKGNWANVKNGNAAAKHVFRDFPIVDFYKMRGGVQALKGTLIEAEAIAKTLRSANYAVSEMSGVIATEESFKALSGSGISILHIGTHGFYQKDDSIKHEFTPLIMSDHQTKEDLSLSKNGLLLAGANSALDPEKRKQIPEGVEDGILTAKEISRLDFKGLDLVVLSACETGLGEITGDGVFGLQRGFKKAGAQTIVMSLWKVADDATQLLMTEFFKNLTSGMSKRESFIAAQNTVKEKYPDPMYWAAFIMVDDI